MMLVYVFTTTGHDPGELSGCHNDVFNMVSIKVTHTKYCRWELNDNPV
jgi:hypothetical protein